MIGKAELRARRRRIERDREKARIAQLEGVLSELIEWWGGDVIDLPALEKITDRARVVLKRQTKGAACTK